MKKDYSLNFPLLKTKRGDKPLVYFDNAATTPKPQAVLDALTDYYNFHNSNIHRGPNFLSEEATNLYEGARDKVAEFIKAKREEIVFTGNATTAFNLVARSWGEANLKKGDAIALSRAEHHANFLPWLQLKEKLDLEILYIEVDSDGNFSSHSLDKIFAHPKLKILAITQASNVLGKMYDLQAILDKARERGVVTVVDACQSVPHADIDISALQPDFLIFSAHKLFAPSGVGVLYGRLELLEKIPPFLTGGGMVAEAGEKGFKSLPVPTKFEAGTPNIEGVISLGAALDYLNYLGREELFKKEQALTEYFLKRLAEFPFLHLLGGKDNRLPLFALTIDGVHPHDAADLLGEAGVITRAGHHCAQSLHDFFSLPATLRLSLAFYNSEKEIDYFFKTIEEIHDKLKA